MARTLRPHDHDVDLGVGDNELVYVHTYKHVRQSTVSSVPWFLTSSVYGEPWAV